jgi:hypothetical protein
MDRNYQERDSENYYSKHYQGKGQSEIMMMKKERKHLFEKSVSDDQIDFF